MTVTINNKKYLNEGGPGSGPRPGGSGGSNRIGFVKTPPQVAKELTVVKNKYIARMQRVKGSIWPKTYRSLSAKKSAQYMRVAQKLGRKINIAGCSANYAKKLYGGQK